MTWTWLLFVVALGNCTGAKYVESKKESIGRFRLGVPAPLTVGYRAQSIYDVEVRTVPIVEGRWAARLAELGSRLRSQPELGEKTQAAWFIQNPAIPSALLLEAMRTEGDFVLWGKLGAPTGKEAIGERLMRSVLTGFVPSVTTGFCLGPGAIRKGPSVSESARITLTEPGDKGVKVEFSTLTVARPDTKTFMNLDEERTFATTAGGTMTVLRERDRTVAGLVGREIWIVMALPAEGTEVRFTWHYPGVGEDGTKPRIDIIGRSAHRNQNELERVWEAMLPSIETVPVS